MTKVDRSESDTIKRLRAVRVRLQMAAENARVNAMLAGALLLLIQAGGE